jgi:hypothetical protein
MMALLAGSGLALAQAPEQPRSLLPSGWLPRSLGRSAAVAPADTINSMPVVTPAAPGTAVAVDPVKPKPGAAAPEQVTVIPPAYADPGSCCTAEGPAPDRGRFYGGAEYLYWTVRGQKLPPLVTQGGDGVVGDQGTRVLFGDSEVDSAFRSGGRVFAGVWLGQERALGIEVGGFYFQPHSTRLGVASDSSTILGRPFVQAPGFFENAFLPASPMVSAGTVSAATSNHFWGAEANVRGRLTESGAVSVDLLGGFRYLQLKDDLDVTSTSTPVPPPPLGLPFLGQFVVPVTSLTVADSFRARNEFYGGQVGAEAVLRRGRLDLDLRGKLALGFVHETVDVGGASTLVTPTQTTSVPGGVLAQTTNIGHHTRDVFAVAPELGVIIGYQLTRHVHLQAGYSALFLTDGVVRAGNQIDRAVDVNRIAPLTAGAPTTPSPRFAFHDTDFWAHGLNAGLEWNF